MYEDKEHLVAAGDCVHQRPGIMHYLFDYSPDMEYLEVVGPADFGTVDMESTIPVPAPHALVQGPGCARYLAPASRAGTAGAMSPATGSVAARTRCRVRRSAPAPSVRRRTTPSCRASAMICWQ